MEYVEFLTLLDIDDPSEFEFFESMATLMESDEYIREDHIYKLFAGADTETVEEILNDYFTEIQDGVPEASTDFYTFLETVKFALTGLLKSSDVNDSDTREDALSRFVEEIYKFREWFNEKEKVLCKDIKTGEEKKLSVRDAIVLSRIENLGGNKHKYDFDSCLDYEINEYIMTYADMMREEE